MGAQISLSTKLGENELVRKFTGLEPITDNDPFWNQLLSFNLKVNELNTEEAKRFDEGTTDLLEALMYNSPTTGNFAAFIRVFLRRATELKTSAQCDDKIFLWQTSNALLILRHCCKFLTQRLSENEFTKMFNKNILNNEGKIETSSDCEDNFENTAEEFLNALIEIVVDLTVNELTLRTHLETAKCIFCLLSCHFYQEKPLTSSLFLNYFMNGRCSIHAPLLAKTLLHNFVSHSDDNFAQSQFDGGGSLVLGLAATMWNVLQWGAGVQEEAVKNDIIENIGNLSLLLLLILACHHQTDISSKHNPYRETLAAFQNAQELATLTGPTQSVATFKLDYAALYERLCASVVHEPPMLLLYLLLHRNSGFRNYVLSRVNLENLVLPVLRVLQDGQKGETTIHGSCHQVYLALIVVLILSEDDFFCKIVHETMVKNIDWYNSDRPLPEISLGGLIVLILVRTIQVNIVKTRDRYLHTNCLAALANMSSFFKQLPATVCQKLVALLEVLTKRHAKLVEHIRLSAEYDLSQAQGQNALHQQDITALEEGIRTLLEIINSCLTHGLRHNAHLVYTILYKRDLFDAFQHHPMFQDLIWNISAVVNHFAGRVSSLEKGCSVTEVLDVIQKGALQWPTDRLKKFPDLKFKYVEDDNTEEFFVPYVWKLVYMHSTLRWDPTRIKLFNAQNLVNEI